MTRKHPVHNLGIVCCTACQRCPQNAFCSNLPLHAPGILSLVHHQVLAEGCNVVDWRPTLLHNRNHSRRRPRLCFCSSQGIGGWRLRRGQLNLITHSISIESPAATRPCCQQSSCMFSGVCSVLTPCKSSFSLAWSVGLAWAS